MKEMKIGDKVKVRLDGRYKGTVERLSSRGVWVRLDLLTGRGKSKRLTIFPERELVRIS